MEKEEDKIFQTGYNKTIPEPLTFKSGRLNGGTPPFVEPISTTTPEPSPAPTQPTYDDPELQKLADQDPDTAARVNAIMKAQNLEGALASAKDEQDRETNVRKRAVNNAKILAMGNLIGNLAKFGVVAGHPNGTDMPYVDISSGAMKQAEAARAREDAARKNYFNIKRQGDMSRASLIQQGYQSADRRKAQEEARKQQEAQLKYNYEKLAADERRNAAALQRQLDNDAWNREYKDRELAQKAAQHKASLAVQWYNAKHKNEGSGKGNSGTVSLTYADGNSSYDLPKNKWTIHQKKQAWDAVDQNDREEILKGLAMNIEEIDDPEAASELNATMQSFGRSSNKAASTKNISEKVLDMALATAMNGDQMQFQKLHKYMKTLTGANTEGSGSLLDLPTGNKSATTNNGTSAVSNTRSGSAFGSPKK